MTVASVHFHLCSQLAVEAVFLEAASQLIGPNTSGISERQAELLEQTAFDWVLSVENSRYVELMEPRRKVRPAAWRQPGWGPTFPDQAALSLAPMQSVAVALEPVPGNLHMTLQCSRHSGPSARADGAEPTGQGTCDCTVVHMPHSLRT